MLSVLAAGLGSRCAFALGLTERLEQQLRASLIGAAGVAQAVRILSFDESTTVDGPTDIWFRNEPAFSHQSFGDGFYSVSSNSRFGLVDEERRLNLNKAPLAVLERLILQQAGVRQEEAGIIASAIIDWVDADNELLVNGAEDFYYLGRSPAYECKDGPFESVEELLLVRGMTPEILERIRAQVTVFGEGAVNLNTADAAVLSALGLSPQGVDQLMGYRAGEDNVEETEDDRLLPSVSSVASEVGAAFPAEDASRLARLAEQKLVDVKSSAFAVSVLAQSGNEKYPVTVSAVVDRKGNILSWQQR